MNLLFGISLIILTLGVLAWAIFGPHLAKLPVFAGIGAFMAGGYNVPNLTDAELDAVPHNSSLSQPFSQAMWGIRGDYDEADLEARARQGVAPTQEKIVTGGIRGWFLGDYNIPTEAEVTDHARRRAAWYPNACSVAMRKAKLSTTEDGAVVLLNVFNPMPEATTDEERDIQRRVAILYAYRKNVHIAMGGGTVISPTAEYA